MCNKAVFIFLEAKKEDEEGKKKKERKQTYCYLYKKLFDFIEQIINAQENPYEDMTQEPEETSLQTGERQEGEQQGMIDEMDEQNEMDDMGPTT